jgi:hypothetical protein
MIRDLAKDFSILELCSYERELSEGPRHSGMSAILGFSGREAKGLAAKPPWYH